jgi:hypothetical protein
MSSTSCVTVGWSTLTLCIVARSARKTRQILAAHFHTERHRYELRQGFNPVMRDCRRPSGDKQKARARAPHEDFGRQPVPFQSEGATKALLNTAPPQSVKRPGA